MRIVMQIPNFLKNICEVNMERLLQISSFLYLLAATLAQVVSDVREDSSNGNLNDGQMPSQLAICIFLNQLILNMF